MEDTNISVSSNGLIYSVVLGDKTVFLDTSDEGMKIKNVKYHLFLEN